MVTTTKQWNSLTEIDQTYDPIPIVFKQVVADSSMMHENDYRNLGDQFLMHTLGLKEIDSQKRNDYINQVVQSLKNQYPQMNPNDMFNYSLTQYFMEKPGLLPDGQKKRDDIVSICTQKRNQARHEYMQQGMENDIAIQSIPPSALGSLYTHFYKPLIENAPRIKGQIREKTSNRLEHNLGLSKDPEYGQFRKKGPEWDAIAYLNSDSYQSKSNPPNMLLTDITQLVTMIQEKSNYFAPFESNMMKAMIMYEQRKMRNPSIVNYQASNPNPAKMSNKERRQAQAMQRKMEKLTNLDQKSLSSLNGIGVLSDFHRDDPSRYEDFLREFNEQSAQKYKCPIDKNRTFDPNFLVSLYERMGGSEAYFQEATLTYFDQKRWEKHHSTDQPHSTNRHILNSIHDARQTEKQRIESQYEMDQLSRFRRVLQRGKENHPQVIQGNRTRDVR